MSKKENLLIDVTPIRLLSLEEGAGKTGKMVVRGEFARAGAATENKRIYPEAVWSKEIKRLNEAMKDRRVFGEIDHPTDGRTSLQRVSHVVTSMKVEDGVLIGEAEILPTEKGKILEALLKSNCKVGVSSRGFGSVKANDEGVDVVQEDYRLVTFDFVAEPADQTAYPAVFFEGVEIPDMGKLDSDIRAHASEDEKKAAEWAKQLGEKEEKSVLPEELLTRLEALRAEVRDEVRGELLSDPAVAGALQAIESIKAQLRPFVLPEDAEAVVTQKDSEIKSLKKQLAEKELKIKELEEDVEKLGNVAKEAGYKFYLERSLQNDPDSELIRNLIGDVKQYANSDELKARVEAVRTELAKKREEEAATEARIAEEVNKARAEKDAAEKQVADLVEAVEQLMEANKALTVKLNTEKKLRNNPRSAKIRSIVESSGVESDEAVDRIVTTNSASNPHDSDDGQSLRAKVRRSLDSRTRESSALDEETRSSKQDNTLFGVPMGQLRNLSGIERGR